MTEPGKFKMDRRCTTCGKVFDGKYEQCRSCRPKPKPPLRNCIDCGREFRNTTIRCPSCRRKLRDT